MYNYRQVNTKFSICKFLILDQPFKFNLFFYLPSLMDLYFFTFSIYGSCQTYLWILYSKKNLNSNNYIIVYWYLLIIFCPLFQFFGLPHPWIFYLIYRFLFIRRIIRSTNNCNYLSMRFLSRKYVSLFINGVYLRITCNI